jgi:hypothetical protein
VQDKSSVPVGTEGRRTCERAVAPWNGYLPLEGLSAAAGVYSARLSYAHCSSACL